MANEKLDVLAVGDTTIDAFIRLTDAEVHCTVNRERCELCLRFGDKVPYDSVTVLPAVGNAANAAVSAARLGLRSGFLGWVGDDENGTFCIETLAGERVDTSLMTKEPGVPTNYHFVLWFGAERTILVRHERYSYRFPAHIDAPRFLYLSSLGEHARPYHAEIARYLMAHPDTQLAFQPGTFQIRMGRETLKEIYAQTSLFFCNKGEAKSILGTQEDDPRALLSALRALGPRAAIITDERNGAYAMNADGAWQVPMYPDPAPPLERTGAGDAFSSTVVAALALGKTLPEALAWGPVNAMSVVQRVGAREGLLSLEALSRLLAEAPATYAVSSL